MMRNVDAVIFASLVFPARRKMPEIMPSNCGESLITAFDGSRARRKAMNEFEFTLKFQLADAQIDPDRYADALYADGCSDAVIGVGRKGKIAFQFTREAESAQAAILSAIGDIRQTIPDVKLIEASPDFVGVSELAQILDCTRQNVRVLIERASDAPPAVHEGTSSLWHLADLLTWLKDSKDYEIDPVLLEVAQTTRLINLVRNFEALQTIDPSQRDNLVLMVA
jgi:hypothetical protein